MVGGLPEANDGLENISLKMKLAFASGNDDEGNPTCKLALKSFELGFPAPNFAQWHRHNGKYINNPFQDTALKSGEVEIATLKTLGGQSGSVINWLDTWYLSAFMPGTVNAAKLLLGLTLTREVQGKTPGIVHLGADTAIPFLGPSAGDTYDPFTGQGGLIIKVVKAKEEKAPECFPKKQVKHTRINAPVNITLLGHSYRKDKKGKPLPLKFEESRGPG